jgi:hypothetical protein
MKRPPKFLVVCAAIVVGLYVAYLVFFPTVYLRYRLTLDVDVDGVTRTGSGVVETAYPGMPDWLSESISEAKCAAMRSRSIWASAGCCLSSTLTRQIPKRI